GYMHVAPLCFYVFFFFVLRVPPSSPLFPYTTLFRSVPSPVDRLCRVDRPASNAHDTASSSICRKRSVARDGSLPVTFPDYPERRSEEHTSELQSRGHLVCRLLLEKKKQKKSTTKPLH